MMNTFGGRSQVVKTPGFAAACLLALATSFGAVQAQADPMKHPINCATAEGDIRALKAERKHAEDQKLLDVASVTPAGALLGIATGTEHKRLEMLTGEYEKQIDARISETQEKCGVS